MTALPSSGVPQPHAKETAPVPPAVDRSEAPTLAPPPGSEKPTLPPREPHAAPGSTTSGKGEPQPAFTILGYDILGELGRGGMGVVYKARQTRLQRLVALKMIVSGIHAGEAEQARFRTEAEAIARLQHPNIVEVHEIGDHDGKPFFALEFCAGGSLEKKLGGTPLPPGEAARLIETLARAMQAAHEAKVLHRDLKPANVLLTEAGIPKITDFGLAKKLDDVGQTQPGAIMGTPSYMAPEQAGGQSKDLGPGCDIYGLGALLYECLTGRPPFKAATELDTILQVIGDEPVPPSQLQSKTPKDLETICLKCLQKEPARRYASAEALAEDLRRFRAGEPVLARPVGRLERAWRWCRRNPAVAALTALVAVALLAGTAVSVYFAVRAGAEAEQAEANAVQAEQETARARRNEQEARENLYVSQMSQAHLAWQAAQAARVQELLDLQDPKRTGGPDFRGFEWYYLRRLLHSERLTLRGKGVVFRPRTNQVALTSTTASGPKVTAQVELRDTGTGTLVRRFPGRLVGFSGDGRQLVTVFPDSRGPAAAVAVWAADTGKQLATFPGALPCAFSRDGKRLAWCVPGTGGPRRLMAVDVWEWETRKKVATLTSGEFVNALAFSPDGKLLAQAGAFSLTGQLLRHRSSGLLLVGKVWEVDTGKTRWAIRQLGMNYSLAFSPDGELLATADGPLVRLRDARTGKEIRVLHGRGVKLGALAFSPDGRILATVSTDSIVCLWDISTDKLLRTYRGHAAPVREVVFSPDGKVLATADDDGVMKLWDATRDQEGQSVGPLVGRWAGALAFEPGSERLAVACEGVRAWDITRRRWADRPLLPKSGFIAYSADGRRLVILASKRWGSAGSEMEIIVRDGDGKGPRVLATIKRHPYGMALSRDGRRLAVRTAGGAEVWDLDAGKPLLSLESKHGVGGVAFSPDGKRLSVAKQSSPVTVRDLAAGGAVVRTLGANGNNILGDSLAFSQDGRRVLAAAEGRAYVWDTDSGQARDFGLGGRVTKAAFSADGRRLATGGQDGRVVLWDVRTGQQLLALQACSQPLALAFSPDGRRLAAGGSNGREDAVKVWDATPP
jgi:WD40 repeat protein/tRNA A-37 threonylcarbamoyl transferase component Bud32